jgi:hypothetical protein
MMGPTYVGRVDTLSAGSVLGGEHAPIGIMWHAQPRGVQPPSFDQQGGLDFHMYGRGVLEIADAPAIEAGVARWFELAAALATRDDGASALPSEGVDLTIIVSLYRPDRRGKPVFLAEDLAPRRLTTADIDPKRLALPPNYRATPWSGLENVSGIGGISDATAAHWRTLEDSTSQRARASCKQAWLPELVGGGTGDTSLTTRPRVQRP